MTLTLQDVLDRGLTRRQIAHWVDEKLLHPTTHGRGRPRQWPQRELQVADLTRTLLDAGLTLHVAAMAARAHLAGHPIKLAPGIILAIDTGLPTKAGERCG
jgi:DNA-binding transcriptional MerR regulator